MLEHFADPERRRLLHDRRRQRRRSSPGSRTCKDTPTPSGNSAAALGLLRLARSRARARYENAAAGVIEPAGALAARHPTGFGHLLQAIDFRLAPAREVAIVAPGAGSDSRTHSSGRSEAGFVPTR